MMVATVIAVSRSPGHSFGKPVQERIRLLAGQGVEGDAHCGETVKHRSRVRRAPAGKASRSMPRVVTFSRP